MRKENLDRCLRMLKQKTERKLKELSPDQQEKFLEGMFFAFNILVRYANLAGLSPFDREMFIGSAKCSTFNKAGELNLKTTWMEVIENSSFFSSELAGLTHAAELNKLLDIPLDEEELQQIRNAESMAKMEDPKNLQKMLGKLPVEEDKIHYTEDMKGTNLLSDFDED